LTTIPSTSDVARQNQYKIITVIKVVWK